VFIFNLQKSHRFAIVVLAALIYLAFAWALVDARYVRIRGDLYLALVTVWLAGVVALCWQGAALEVSRTLRVVFYRLLWFNVGSVIVAVLVPSELRFLLLVVPLFGLLYASLRLHQERVVFIAVFTWVCYAAAAAILLSVGVVEPAFEALAGVAFSFLLAGTLYFARDLHALRRRAESRHQHLERSVAELSIAAMRDELTGTFNRRYISEALQRHKALADRDRLDFTVCYCDLDHFKRVNDELGHVAGDRALVQFADLARGLVRSMDYVARFGGEEFLLVLVGANEAVARRVCERLCAGTRNLVIEGRQSASQRLTVSCGIARYRLGESVEELLQRADQALYEAKRGGRDQVVTAGE
jgi:diguanylate cyclase (GGDEF)-like protein